MEERKDSTQVAIKFDANVLDTKEIDPEGLTREWLSEQLCEDSHCGIDVLDIHHAFILRFGSQDGEAIRILYDIPASDIAAVMALLVTSIFPNATLSPSRHHPSYSNIKGVRWRKLDRCIFSDAVPLKVSTKFRDEAHPLLHLPQPARSVAWLKMYFKSDYRVSLSMHSIGALYEQAFSRSRDTHGYLSRSDLQELVLKTFRGTETVEVTKEYSVIRGLSGKILPGDINTPAERVLAKKRRAEYRQLLDAGLVREPPKPINTFTKQLLADPLIQLSFKYERPEPGPFVERLRRRAKDTREPLGDEEPGFPGISLKKEQQRVKRKLVQWNEWNKIAINRLTSMDTPLTSVERNAVMAVLLSIPLD